MAMPRPVPPLPDTIVCLPINEWSGLPVNSHHLMREAGSRGYRVLYVDPIGLRRPALARKDMAKLSRRLRQVLRPLSSVAPGVWRLATVGVPLQDSRRGIALNKRLLAPQIRFALRRLKSRRVLLWVYPPQLFTLHSAIPYDLAIYYRTDEYVSLPGMNGELLGELESHAVETADLCIAPSRRYLDGPLRAARSALWVPNAVDDRMFDRSRIGADPLPCVNRPRLLMMGTFDEWVDVDLLRAVMTANPRWNLVLAGDVKISLERLLALENVHFVGRVPYEQLSTLVSHCDVGLVPFRIGPVAADATPSKLYQYLAGGLPVLCTPFTSEDAFAGNVAVAPGDPVAFGGAIEHLLADDSPAARQERRAFAHQHSWSARFDAIEAALGRLSLDGATRLASRR
jgi:glycosyltransferase involved in cell wall biosynthesis